MYTNASERQRSHGTKRKKSFRAKYRGKCSRCYEPITPRQEIYYMSSGSKPIHVSGGTKEVQSKAKATRAKAPDISPESWEMEQAYLDWQKVVVLALKFHGELTVD